MTTHLLHNLIKLWYSDRNAVVLGGLLVVVGLFGRLLPHAPNATPLTAIIVISYLFLGGGLLSVWLPLCILAITDVVLGVYHPAIMLSVYGSFLLIAWMGSYTLKKPNIFAVFGTLTVGAGVFFLVTNAAVWWFTPWYEKSLAGLLLSYEYGLPFLRNMFIGDLFYTGLLAAAAVVLGVGCASPRRLPDAATMSH